ncbi:hypothetical protein DRW03_24890 [Corallococcus sp. H22C18031201]|uniref:hypothetical protein n=1 Tax=Citreicoccus inhibens TaxID=2849499 RepID=UPI000E7120DB|nr:hypothetical protein [Citreicoccus inhibens]MBU8899709.1 hypothetical protein [Citreicoccus inhibens]RJS18369.1 hypothetical protein DRW03_24890 [Corallococcus sp. H22C18031201]
MELEASPLERRSIVQGMRVRDEDGALLGYVAFIGQEHLYVRRWPFSRQWGEVPLSAVRQVLAGAVRVEGRGPAVMTPAPPGLHGEIPTQTFPVTVGPDA